MRKLIYWTPVIGFVYIIYKGLNNCEMEDHLLEVNGAFHGICLGIIVVLLTL